VIVLEVGTVVSVAFQDIKAPYCRLCVELQCCYAVVTAPIGSAAKRHRARQNDSGFGAPTWPIFLTSLGDRIIDFDYIDPPGRLERF